MTYTRVSNHKERSSNSIFAAPAQTTGGMKGIVAGGITGGIEICITYPTEFIKTRLQLDESSSKSGGARQFAGPIDCVKKTVNQKGFFGLYRGLSVLLYGSIPKSAVRFGAFEEFKKLLVNDKGQLTASTRLLAGLGAGVRLKIFLS
jgi:solute carrier family 25 citrate transporter 1